MNYKTEKLQICACGEPYVKQFTLDVKVPSDGIAIAKVLAAPVSVCVAGTTVAEGEAEVKGTICCRVLYIDGEGARKVSHTEVDFCERVRVTAAEASALSDVSVIDVDTTRVQTDCVTLKCVFEAKINVVDVKTVCAVTQADDGIFVQNGTLNAMAFVGCTQARLVDEGSKEIPDADSDVLLVESTASLAGITARMDCFVANVNVVTDVVYRAQDGQLKKTSFVTPTANEIALKGLSAQSLVCAVVSGCEAKSELKTPDGGVPSLFCTWTVNVHAYAVNPVSYTVFTDAFSATHKLEVEKENVCSCALSQAYVSRKIEGSASLDDALPACDTVLCVAGSRMSVANVYVANGKVVTEGILFCSVLYLNKEYGTTNAVEVEIPYSMPIVDGEAGQVYTVSATVTNAHASTLHTGRIDVVGEVDFAVTACQRTCVECVSGLVLGEELVASGAGLTVYVARKEQSLWEIAKALSVTPDTVLKLNADVTFPTKAGQKIVLYRQLS